MKTTHAKKALFVLAAACLAVLAIAFAVVSKNNSLQSAEIEALNFEVDNMEVQMTERNETISDFMISFDEVEANLDVIREKEARLREFSEDEEIMGGQKDRMVRDIQVINTLMAENRDKISRLEKRLRSSGLKIKQFDQKLADLKSDNLAKDEQIAELRGFIELKDVEIEELNSVLTSQEAQVAILDGLVEVQEEELEIQDNEMHKVFFTTGSFKELKEKGIVEKDGALFGVIGGDKRFTGDIKNDDFIQVDMRELEEVPIFAKKAKLITSHPESSYAFEKDENGKISTLEITNPDQFWESSPYLVVALD